MLRKITKNLVVASRSFRFYRFGGSSPALLFTNPLPVVRLRPCFPWCCFSSLSSPLVTDRLRKTKMLKTTTALLLVLGIAAPLAAQARRAAPASSNPTPPISFRPFFLATGERMLARTTFNAVFGQSVEPFLGGGVEVAFRTRKRRSSPTRPKTSTRGIPATLRLEEPRFGCTNGSASRLMPSTPTSRAFSATADCQRTPKKTISAGSPRDSDSS